MKVTQKWLFLACAALSVSLVRGQRVEYSINDSWRFFRGEMAEGYACGLDDTSWQVVSIPHTWNAEDCQDEEPGYYRGTGWYRRKIAIPAEKIEGQVYVFFEGANQVAELYVNGRMAGSHIGGYTAFVFDITPFVRAGENTLAVRVDNSHNADIPPLSADFTFFGGIYRDVYLLFTSKVHIATTHYASGGVYISTPQVDGRRAKVRIKTLVDNDSSLPATVRVNHTILDPEGKQIASLAKEVKLADRSRKELVQEVVVQNPLLWDVAAPNLYQVYTTITDPKGKMLDRTVNPLGIRHYRFDPDHGFFLNDRHLKLIGTNRHQDYYKKGNALPDEMHVRDVMLLKKMGGNFLRVSHYPQDPVVMQMCDKLGILTSVEIPVVNAVTDSRAFNENCVEMAREMVLQNYNSPSVIIWSYMNEVMLRPPYDKEQPEAEQAYFRVVERIASNIENELRSLDPERYTMLPCHGNPKIYQSAGLTKLPMILGWNLYHGWYSGAFSGFDSQIDEIHAIFPDQPQIITEYGADADPRLHSFRPERFDFTVEYADLYHEHYLGAIMRRDYIAGATIWNLNDFYSESRRDAIPNVNSKGISGLDRTLKDSYVLYKARFHPEPLVRIGNAAWRVRGGVADERYECRQPVKVYTNGGEVELKLNGRSLGSKKAEECIASFEVPFTNGSNRLEAVSRIGNMEVADVLTIDFRMSGVNLRDQRLPFREVNMMLGSKRYFEDREVGMVWLPERAYTEGSWGYIGGQPVVAKSRFGTLPAIDRNILGTTQDPLFQTQRKNIEAVRFDVPAGSYAVYLYFAELQSPAEREALAYNLGNDTQTEKLSGSRIFDVVVNGQTYLEAFDLSAECGPERAVVKKLTVNVAPGENLTVGFTPVSGETILNAIRIYKMY